MKYLRKITESITYYEVAETYKKPYGDGGNRIHPNRHQVGVPKVEVHEDWRELTEVEQAVYVHPTVAQPRQTNQQDSYNRGTPHEGQHMTPEEREAWYAARIKRGLAEGEFITRQDGAIVCSTCGGNCGQCGNTDIIGNIPFSFDTVIHSMQEGKPALRRKSILEYLGFKRS